MILRLTPFILERNYNLPQYDYFGQRGVYTGGRSRRSEFLVDYNNFTIRLRREGLVPKDLSVTSY